MAKKPRPLILDACCGINLLASGSLEEIVRAQGLPIAVADLVLDREVLRLPDEGGAYPEVGVDRILTLRPLVEAGHIDVMSVESGAETDTFVELAFGLDDGEALSAAIAIHRNGVLATDDRKAIRVLSETAPDLEIQRTSDLLRMWVQVADPPDRLVREVLHRIEQDARFVPPATDPNVNWWRTRRP